MTPYVPYDRRKADKKKYVPVKRESRAAKFVPVTPTPSTVGKKQYVPVKPTPSTVGKKKYVPIKPSKRTGKYTPITPEMRKKNCRPVVRDPKTGNYVPLKDESTEAKAPSEYAAAQYTPNQPTAHWTPSWLSLYQQQLLPNLLPNINMFPLDDYQLLHAIRGRDYPVWYQGFVDETYCRIEIEHTSNNVSCEFIIGPNYLGQKSNISDAFTKMHHRDVDVASVSFYQDGHNVNDQIWPDSLDTDMFDKITICPRGGSIDLRHIRIMLNGLYILDRDINRHIDEDETLDLGPMIAFHRLEQVPGAFNNLILMKAAYELGKAWSPKYGKIWPKVYLEKKRDMYWFKPTPGDWCSEFCSWVFRHSTNLKDLPDGDIWHKDLAKYFEDINRFIAPDHSNQRKTIFISYANLFNAIKVGYYARVRSWQSGPLGNHIGLNDEVEDDVGHSTIFVRWSGLTIPNNPVKRKYFLGLGGSQDNIVCIKTFSVSSMNPTTDDKLNENLPDVVWNQFAYNAYKKYNYNGFGITYWG